MKKLKRVLLFVAMPLAVAVTMSLSSYSSMSSGRCPAVDPQDHTVLLPNPADCSSFFMCSNGVPILQKCPASPHFNANLGVCDWPQQAGCEMVGPVVKSRCYTVFSNLTSYDGLYYKCGETSSDPNIIYMCSDVTRYKPAGMSLSKECYDPVAL